MGMNQHKQSVIAKLMGFDDMPPQQIVTKQQRVLSEEYLRKSASIGLREGSSFHIGKNVFDLHVSKKDKQNVLSAADKEANSNTSKTQMGLRRTKIASAPVLNSIPVTNYNYEGIFNKKYKQHARGNVLRSLQKFENESLTGNFEKLGADQMNKSKSWLERIDQPHLFSTSIIGLKPNSKMAKSDSRYTRSNLLPRSGDREHGVSLPPEEGMVISEYNGQAINDMDSTRHIFNACQGITNGTSQQDMHGNSHIVAARPHFSGDNYLINERESLVDSCPGFFDCKDQKYAHSFSNGSYLARQAKKQIFDPWEITKKAQAVESSERGQNFGEMLAMADWELTLQNMNLELNKHFLGNPSSLQGEILESGCASAISSRNVCMDQDITGSPISKVEVLDETFSNGWLLRQEEADSPEENKLWKQKIFRKDDSEHRGPTCGEKFLSSPGILVNNNLEDYKNGTLMIQYALANGPQSRDIEHNLTVSISNIASQTTIDNLANAQNDNIEISSSVHKWQQSEPNPGIFLVQDRHRSSHVMETLSGQFCSDSPSRSWEAMAAQVPSNEISEGESVSSNCLRICPPELQRKGANLCSTDSILEPFEEENCLTSEYFESVITDFYSQQLQLQFLKCESEENYSKGSGMAVSTDLNSEEGFHEPSEDVGKRMRLFGNEDSRDFSYLVNVLDEAAYHGLNLEMDFETWHSLECPVSPSIFDALERKYGKQTTWHKLQRQLLFDRINSGLREIINPPINFHASTPLRRRFSAKWMWDEVAEELWMLLVSQEKGKSKDLSEKALEKEKKWLDLDEDINIIYQELEIHLFDDLVMELVLLETTE